MAWCPRQGQCGLPGGNRDTAFCGRGELGGGVYAFRSQLPAGASERASASTLLACMWCVPCVFVVSPNNKRKGLLESRTNRTSQNRTPCVCRWRRDPKNHCLQQFLIASDVASRTLCSCKVRSVRDNILATPRAPPNGRRNLRRVAPCTHPRVAKAFCQLPGTLPAVWTCALGSPFPSGLVKSRDTPKKRLHGGPCRLRFGVLVLPRHPSPRTPRFMDKTHKCKAFAVPCLAPLK